MLIPIVAIGIGLLFKNPLIRFYNWINARFAAADDRYNWNKWD